ncbi:DUF1992 domain-containing protein [Terrabacter sp. Root85]|uniref:DnaJ family domain-containing protein n=1 Tax=Terrabacter sp. Root85 TaxID=1736603 RepID=UPI000A9A4620|nr:DUF1992 domain-containing protein [Terrabacter sp. Root85]
MTGQPYWESPVDKQIREAQERGEFDNLPGAGKPLDLSDSGDPDWWVKRFAARENLDLGGALPGALGLRKEAAGYPESLVDVRTEAQFREVIEDYNKRVLAEPAATGGRQPAAAHRQDPRRRRDGRALAAAARRARGAAARSPGGQGCRGTCRCLRYAPFLVASSPRALTDADRG